MRHMYKNRYERGMQELDNYSKVHHDPSESIFKDRENFVIELEFDMPQSSLKIYDKNTDESNDRSPILYSVFEGLTLKMRQESKTEYFNLFVSFTNFYIRDFFSPQPSLPFVVQTVMLQNVQDRQKHDDSYFDNTVLELQYEHHPKDTKHANSRLRLKTHG